VSAGPASTSDAPVDVLVTGVGAVGAYAVEFLARTPGLNRVVALDVNADAAAGVAIRAEAGAAMEGHTVRVEGYGADLRNVDATAALIAEFQPKAVLHIATLLPIGRMAKELDPAVFTKLRQAGFGTWMPVNALLSLQLVRAIEAAGTDTAFIDIPFPDFINPVLSRMGFDVLAGGGNVDNLVGQLRVGIARSRGISVDRVRVALVAPHAVAESFQREHSSSGWQYIARAFVDDVDVTESTDIEGILGSTSAVIEHVALDSRVASSGVAMATAVAKGETAYVHAAGPQGLVGGYPVSLSASGTEILLPDGVTLDEAVAVNEAGLVAGGIESIGADGTIVFTDNAVATMSELFGVTHATVDPSSIDEHAAELVSAYRRYIEEH
jgi:hypothetical protein